MTPKSLVDAQLLCPTCDYNLHALTSDRCPECGELIDWKEAALSRIPWEHRRRLGFLRAFFKTAILAIFRPGWFVSQIDRPLRLKDATRFQYLCVTISSGLSALALTGWIVAAERIQIENAWGLLLIAAVYFAIIFWLAVLLASFLPVPAKPIDDAITDEMSKSRFEILVRYATTPAWMALPAVVLAVGWAIYNNNAMIAWDALAAMALLVLLPTSRFLWLAVGPKASLCFLIAQPILAILVLVLTMVMCVPVGLMILR